MKPSSNRLSVKDWSPEDKPREKLLLKGIQSLSDAELLAIIIGSGNRDETVVELAQRILNSADNSLSQLGKYSVKQLIADFKGIGEAKAISIVAALELGKRRKASELLVRDKITSSRDIYQYFHPLLCDLPHEEFWIVFLNRSNKIIDKLKISQGGIHETVVDGKIIYKEALLRLASGIILCHNHPSGNTQPSTADERITQKIKKGLELLDISLLDHLIVCDSGYYSFLDEGKL